MFSAKWIFLCNILAILSAASAIPAPDTHEEYDLASTKVNIEEPEENEPLQVGLLSKPAKVEFRTLRPGLADSLVG